MEMEPTGSVDTRYVKATSSGAEQEVKETATADVQESDSGAPEQVNDYTIGALLGEGAYSKVYLCEKTAGGVTTQYAMKILNKSFLKRKREFKKVDGRMVASNAFQKVQKEIAIMKKLRHPNLTHLHEVIDAETQDKMFLVLELVTGGQVMDWDPTTMRYKYIGSQDQAPMAIVQACVVDMALALEYLHLNQICHRDIKPENVLMTNDKTSYKLSDFGVAHMFTDDDMATELKNTEGTYHYLAPECTVGAAFDPFKVDVWALGVTAYAMLYGTLPFGATKEHLEGGALAIMQSIREDPLVLPSTGSDPLCDQVLTRLLDKDPSTRISLSELLQHPWLAAAVHHERASIVEVSPEEISLAFTPVNNFILMTKLKIKFGAKLMKARRTLREESSRSSSIELPSPDGMDEVPASIEPSEKPVDALPPPINLSFGLSLEDRSDSVRASTQSEPHVLQDEPLRSSLHSAPVAPAHGATTPPKRMRSFGDRLFQRQSSNVPDGKKQKDCTCM
ncbi:CAMKK protein kinase [Saprolegnia parasitica CBS 223.65]|uniref:CAMKK protein kinase n=1 Tax=Saprolegnia parasitica (strain CBS 223.65) TaxID=695850 RepID=A0A067C015_SAPPC|nr:CAMKK protein kinase [Saprolegnia parasitica CBS 223.65]KDO19901.1 CAMKK protein kinase [Saprolegnia parasitica CBS 223.65]|eukprot:XP_012209403.1 CAMKK protein kinase [Saprolegnia parasitica CBS 223.65]